MGNFSANWLALREPADHAARSLDLTRATVAAIGSEPSPQILDLASGTGSNLRYLLPHLPAAGWLLVDHDADLLARVPATPAIETRCLDLSSLDHPELFEGRRLVTASALLDLVSEDWLRGLAAACAKGESAVLFVLSYDGRIICTPEDSDDGLVAALVNEHQRTDKGFGPAVGPDATACAAVNFADLGYEVQRAPSDWVLTPDAVELQRQLIDGWTQAACEMSPGQTRLIDRWRERRLAHLAAGWSSITVGHEDLAAWR